MNPRHFNSNDKENAMSYRRRNDRLLSAWRVSPRNRSRDRVKYA